MNSQPSSPSIPAQSRPPDAGGELFVVATPIGNLEDITYRAVRILGECELIAAEDTRTSRRLLDHYGIDTPMVSLHEHNEPQAAARLIPRLQAGARIALITDAGTPLISDPGFRLIRLAIEAGIRVTPVPGPSSVIAALSVAGLPTDRFRFLGFPPRSGRPRKALLDMLAECPETIVLLESPRRLPITLRDLAGVCGEDREAVVARELTKLHEEVVRGTLGGLVDRFEKPPRGEIVLLLAPASPKRREVSDEEIRRLLAEPPMASLRPAARAREAARKLHVDKARVYALIVEGERS
ncbi:MAG: 16S rRNA (cytidine(1402)-2'-O)-methyltransferase [Mariprofundaceae bacterium]